jgi:1-acyl-sn-glycerol-3-phosphate acyltransferase
MSQEKGGLFRYDLVRFGLEIVRRLLRVSYEVDGIENVPGAGAYLVVLNHTSAADTPILLLTFPRVKWRFFAVKKWRAHPVFGPIMAWLGAIYVDREGADTKTLREALAALASGGVFGLAPEGTRSKRGSLMAAKDGAAYLATKGNVPVLPVGIINSDILFANARRLQPTKVLVRIGEPFNLPALNRRARSADLGAYTHYIMVSIASLLPARYWGHYAKSPALAAKLRGEDHWPDSATHAAEPAGEAMRARRRCN